MSHMPLGSTVLHDLLHRLAPLAATRMRRDLAWGTAAALLLGALTSSALGVAHPGVTGAPTAGQESVAGAVDVAPTVLAPGTSAIAPAPAAGLELALFDCVNAERAAHGLPPVALDAELLAIARARAVAQVPESRLTHHDASGRLAFVVLLSTEGAEYRLAGENLARLGGPDESAAERADKALMDSPTHKANILEPTFDRLAVGVARDTRGRIIFAQIFRAA
jgi:uncharacterized protein YkwD